MTQDFEANWGAIFNKGAYTRDDMEIGTVVGITDTHIVIERGLGTIYTVPRHNVAGIDGKTILLDLSYADLVAYREVV